MAAERPIPIYTNLNDLYQNLGTSLSHAVRWNSLAKEFKRRFGREPAYIARAPGRVNLIGEHIDYALFGVLPAAIERDILIACAPRSPDVTSAIKRTEEHTPGNVVAENLHNKYTRQSFAPARRPSVSQEIAEEQVHNDKLDDQHNRASTTSMTKGDLVRMSMENEKRVGVNTGGMDQAASVISDASSALYISFYPILEASPVPLPSGSVFVCANSLVVSDKAVTAKRNYNLRVVETFAGARILAKSLGVLVGEKERVSPREVVGRLLGEKKGQELSLDELQEGLKRMSREVEVLRPKGVPNDGQLGVTLQEMITLSGLSQDVFHEVYMSWIEVEATHFQLYKRAKHVYEEALRVLQFRQTCIETNGINALESLGRLMNESQTSCSELYQCSCPELNELAQLARDAGAYGSRLTGTSNLFRD
ncbi:hypothetical protein H0H93_012640 [Arthromyces matolae]|nr:hypothetical protein H0H93_012640 [Arthromyces matolae]